MVSSIFSTRVVKQPVGIPATIVHTRQALSVELSDSKPTMSWDQRTWKDFFLFLLYICVSNGLHFHNAAAKTNYGLYFQKTATEPNQIKLVLAPWIWCAAGGFDLQMGLNTEAWFQSRCQLGSFQVEVLVIYVYWSSQGRYGRTWALDLSGCARSMMDGCVGIYNLGGDIYFV